MQRLQSGFALVLLLESLGCGDRAASRAPATPVMVAPGGAVDDHPPERSDCPWVANGCAEDDDGCPEQDGRGQEPVSISGARELDAACDVAVPDATLLGDVAQQLRDKPALTKLSIVSPNTACGAVVRRVLERAGASPDRIETAGRPGGRYVQFEVAAWNCALCARELHDQGVQ